MIEAVTFDLWDTLIRDESDEPKRAARGLRSKRDERRHLLWQALQETAPADKAAVDLAYDVGDAAFNHVWKVQFVNWTIRERLQVILNGLGRELPAARLDALADATARMETDVPPEPIDGARDCLAELSGRYKLCVVSDAIVTPGPGLRELLALHGLADFFSGFVFSDEVGRSKPHRAMFDAAAAQMDVGLHEMVHVGDRDHNDVKGPQKLGMRAVLFTAVREADKAATSADAVCGHHGELPAAIDGLSTAAAMA